MKLFYQSMGVARRSEAGPYARALSAILRTPRNRAPRSMSTASARRRQSRTIDRYLELLDTAEVLDNGLRAERDGYDAFLIGNVFEPGMHALREALNIPVLGLLESLSTLPV